MQYLGGKARIAKHIVKVLPDAKRVWEPFCGGLNMTLELAKRYPYVLASDLHPGPIALGKGLQNGWVPPREVSKADYDAARLLPDSDPLKAFIGFGCSFGGKYFAGPNLPRVVVSAAHPTGMQQDPPGAAAQFCDRLRQHAQRVEFVQTDFLGTQPSHGWVLYCDPPYYGATEYTTDAFEHSTFILHCRAWARAGSRVFVSEYAEIPGARLVWEHVGRKCMHGKNGQAMRTERLYEIGAPPRIYSVPRQLQLAI